MTAILFGLAAGLVYGWVLKPSGPGYAEPASLREDYKTDVVLMTAEIFADDAELGAAVDRLETLDKSQPPLRLVQQAILTGQELGYARTDIETLARLFQALQTAFPEINEAAP